MATHPARFTASVVQGYIQPVYLHAKRQAMDYAKHDYRKRLKLNRPDLSQAELDAAEIIVTDTETGETYPA